MQTFGLVSEAFSRQSEIFDKYEEQNEILKWMRSVTRDHVLRYLKKGNEILEINAGTGLDAVFFAEKGFKIHCTDISEGMLKKLVSNINDHHLNEFVTCRLLSFTELDKLSGKTFDYLFSNFGGLNCSDDLKSIFIHFKKILKPGSKVTLVIIPPLCPWELGLSLKGNFKTAFRRLKKNGVAANIEGVNFQTYYYGVNDVIKALGSDFRVLEIQGLASLSPPPYMINFPRSYPRLYKFLTWLDEKFSRVFPFNRCADHFILTAEYNP